MQSAKGGFQRVRPCRSFQRRNTTARGCRSVILTSSTRDVARPNFALASVCREAEFPEAKECRSCRRKEPRVRRAVGALMYSL